MWRTIELTCSLKIRLIQREKIFGLELSYVHPTSRFITCMILRRETRTMHKPWKREWEMLDILVVNIPTLNLQHTTYRTHVLSHMYVRGLREYVYEYVLYWFEWRSLSHRAASLYRVGLNACVHYWRQFYICFLFVLFFSFLSCLQ